MTQPFCHRTRRAVSTDHHCKLVRFYVNGRWPLSTSIREINATSGLCGE